MTELQKKAQANAPEGRVRESIRNPRASVEDGNIVGHLDWGGITAAPSVGKTWDIAKIIEEGAKPHVIYPLGKEGTRLHQKGVKRRYGSNVLAFYSNRLGKQVFATYVFHPGITGRHFMASALEEMKNVIRLGLKATLQDVLSSRRSNI